MVSLSSLQEELNSAKNDRAKKQSQLEILNANYEEYSAKSSVLENLILKIDNFKSQFDEKFNQLGSNSFSLPKSLENDDLFNTSIRTINIDIANGRDEVLSSLDNIIVAIANKQIDYDNRAKYFKNEIDILNAEIRSLSVKIANLQIQIANIGS